MRSNLLKHNNLMLRSERRSTAFFSFGLKPRMPGIAGAVRSNFALKGRLPGTEAAVEGRLPRGIGIERLRDPPTEWSRQFEALGLIPE
jgi:hypothetical protein